LPSSPSPSTPYDELIALTSFTASVGEEEDEAEWSLVVRVLKEYWASRSKGCPQRLLLALLENSEKVETVAEDCKDKLSLQAAEKNPFFKRVIGL
jgi:hypothetical protein